MKKNNQSKKKLLNYTDRFIDSDSFQKQIKSIRKIFGLPTNGFSMPKKLKEKLINSVFAYSAYYFPTQFRDKKINDLKRINLAIEVLIENFPIKDTQIKTIFRIYLFYNVKLYEIMDRPNEVNLCRIEDIKDEIKAYSSITSSKEVLKILNKNFNEYPVVLKLHPSISRRDLEAYVKDYWHTIAFYLDFHKNQNAKLGKIKTRNPLIKKRDEFIYKNRKMDRKKLSNLVSSRFPEISNSIDLGSIGKIISLERKRRKEV